MFARVCLEVRDQLVQCVLHVHVPDLDPNLVLIGQDGFLFLLGALLVDVGVPDPRTSQSMQDGCCRTVRWETLTGNAALLRSVTGRGTSLDR